jgi:hypothetical protein
MREWEKKKVTKPKAVWLRKTWFLSKGYVVGKFKEILFSKEEQWSFFFAVVCVCKWEVLKIKWFGKENQMGYI